MRERTSTSRRSRPQRVHQSAPPPNTRRTHSIRVWVVSAQGTLLADKTITLSGRDDLAGAASLEDLMTLARVAMAPRVKGSKGRAVSEDAPASEGQRATQQAILDPDYRRVLAAKVLLVIGGGGAGGDAAVIDDEMKDAEEGER